MLSTHLKVSWITWLLVHGGLTVRILLELLRCVSSLSASTSEAVATINRKTRQTTQALVRRTTQAWEGGGHEASTGRRSLGSLEGGGSGEEASRQPSMLDSLVWQHGLHAHSTHVVYMLTCFIQAHEEAQEEMHWMLGKRKATLHEQEVQVVGESQVAVRLARAYLEEVGTVRLHGESVSDIADSVRAVQFASSLIHKIGLFVKSMAEHGVLDARSSHRILEQLDQDHRSLHHLASAAETADGSGLVPSRKTYSEMAAACDQLVDLQQKHMATLSRFIHTDTQHPAASPRPSQTPPRSMPLAAAAAAAATGESLAAQGVAGVGFAPQGTSRASGFQPGPAAQAALAASSKDDGCWLARAHVAGEVDSVADAASGGRAATGSPGKQRRFSLTHALCGGPCISQATACTSSPVHAAHGAAGEQRKASIARPRRRRSSIEQLLAVKHLPGETGDAVVELDLASVGMQRVPFGRESAVHFAAPRSKPGPLEA